MDYNVCDCDQCMPTFVAALENLRLTPAEKSTWLVDLKHPTEAMICSLVMATLPNIKSVALYPQIYPERKERAPCKPNTCPCQYSGAHVGTAGRPNNCHDESSEKHYRSDRAEIDCLSQGLSVTSIQTLPLSTNLNGLHHAKLPSLTTLSLDYSGPNPFVTVGKGSFTNVTTLKLQTRDVRGGYQERRAYANKTAILYKGFRNLRTVEFESSAAAVLCGIPPQVRTVIIRPADDLALPRLSVHFEAAKALERIEMYWPDTEAMPHAWSSHYCDLARKAGIIVVLKWRGQEHEMLEEKR